jgi:lipopolysaccharide transport system ATP-binding protein
MQAMPTVSPFIADEARAHTLRVTIELPPLIPGHYGLTLWAGSHFTETLDLVERALGFDIETSPTPDRTFGHGADHGYLVPASSYAYSPKATLEPAIA